MYAELYSTLIIEKARFLSTNAPRKKSSKLLVNSSASALCYEIIDLDGNIGLNHENFSFIYCSKQISA